MTVRVVLADDQPLVRSGFAMVIDREPDMTVVGEADDGRAAVDLVSTTRPDVVLMDVRMPRCDGVEATRLIAEGPPPIPKVIILTTFDLDEYVYAALRAGASGFLLKDVRPAELLHAVRVVAEGEALLAPTITRRLIGEFTSRVPDAAPPAALGDLTARELEVLRLMARGMSNAELAKALFVSESTAKTHVSRLLTKLGLRDRVQAVVLAYEAGVVLPGRADQ